MLKVWHIGCLADNFEVNNLQNWN